MTSIRRGSQIGWKSGAALLMLALASTPGLARNPLKIPGSQYEPLSWSRIEGWADDDHDEAFATFLKSCKAILQSTPGHDNPMLRGLYDVCKKAIVLNPQKPGEARLFFEQNFRPVGIAPLGSPDGFVTGYYEPIVEGTREHVAGYDTPLYRKPPGLLPGGRMAVAAAAVASDDGKKKKKHARRKLVPFYDRASIDDGVLAGRNLEICWLKDPIDSFFAQIQGSVRVLLDDGKLMRLNYSAANGQPYYAVGRDLIARNIVPKDEMSMDRIRQWMVQHPEEGRELRRKNRSYVFFHETNLSGNDEPVGAEGVSLTPGRSIAVDRRLHTYGTPFFISGYLPIETLQPDTWFRRLMIAQDTGGAIVGPARADLYFGAGNEAESVAGRLRHNARFVMLVPKELMPTTTDEEIPLPRPRPEIQDAPVAAAPSTPAPVATAAIGPLPGLAAPAAPKSAETKPLAKLAATKPAEPAAEKPAKKAEQKPEKKVAAKPAEPAPDKAAKADKSDKKTNKHKKAASKKSDDTKTDAWEARVMPKIAPQSSAPGSAAHTAKHKKKG